MSPAELRRLAAELEARGRDDLAREARNRAAARELGVRVLGTHSIALDAHRAASTVPPTSVGRKTPTLTADEQDLLFDQRGKRKRRGWR